MKQIFLLMAVLCGISFSLSAQAADLSYDPDAVIDPGIKRTVYMGYYVDYLASDDYPYLFFRNPDNRRINYATYNYKQQYWIFIGPAFDPAEIDLAPLYAEIDLNKVTLNRNQDGTVYAENPGSSPHAAGSVEPPEAAEEQGGGPARERDTRPLPEHGSESAAVNIDELTLRPNTALNNTIKDGYLIRFNTYLNNLEFIDPEYPEHNAAVYRIHQKCWIEWIDSAFDAKAVNLQDYFIGISEKQAEALNRWNYIDSHVIRDVRETDYYDYRKDPDFADFVEYLDRIGASPLYKDFYLRIANDPVIRERMQEHFDAHNGNHFMCAIDNYKIYNQNKVLPVAVIELYPKYGATEDVVESRGDDFLKKFETAVERFYKKKADIKVFSAVIDYRGLDDGGPLTGLAYRRKRYLEKNVDYLVPEGSLVFYRFMDMGLMKQIPRFNLGGPLGKGAPMAEIKEWDLYTLFHEMGHTFGLTHHFPPEDFGKPTEDINHHVSPACVMNYGLKTDSLCPLCLYTLGWDP